MNCIKTLGLRGNCCDVGTWKGSSFLFIAKLIKIFEPYSKTKIYGFDWFKGQNPQLRITNILKACINRHFHNYQAI